MGLSLCPGLVAQEPPALMHHSSAQVLQLEVSQRMSSSAVPAFIRAVPITVEQGFSAGLL